MTRLQLFPNCSALGHIAKTLVTSTGADLRYLKGAGGGAEEKF